LLWNGGGVNKPWHRVLEAAGITRRVTLHGLRRTFNNLSRQVAGEIVTRSMTGHVTHQMTEHYSFVEPAEKRAALASILQLVEPVSGSKKASRCSSEVLVKDEA
jgi:integrase